MSMTLLVAPFIHSLWIVVRRFGAFAFFPLGLLDMSFLAPGSFDALLIVLTAAHKELWWYYALMATAGSVFGTWPSFQIGRKGGEQALEKRLGARRSKKIFSAFQRWGFWSMFVGAVAPPPMPASAFVLAAGALHYPWPRFLLAWTLGRLLRFGLLAWITARYGRPHLPLVPRLLPTRALDHRNPRRHRRSCRTLVLYPRTPPALRRNHRSASAPGSITL